MSAGFPEDVPQIWTPRHKVSYYFLSYISIEPRPQGFSLKPENWSLIIQFRRAYRRHSEPQNPDPNFYLTCCPAKMTFNFWKKVR